MTSVSDVLSPEGTNPMTGDKVEAGDTLSYATGAAFVAAGLGIGVFAYRQIRSRVKSFTGTAAMDVPVVGDL